MKVYLQEFIDSHTNKIFSVILLNEPGTDIWLEDIGYAFENIVNIELTDKFFIDLENGEIQLTYIGDL